MYNRDFINKYGFSIEDLENDCINEILSKGYICYDVKELAYEIASKIHDFTDYLTDYYIEYKNEGNVHKIAIFYQDLVFIFNLMWTRTSLTVDSYDFISIDEYNKLEGFEDIESVIEDEETEC